MSKLEFHPWYETCVGERLTDEQIVERFSGILRRAISHGIDPQRYLHCFKLAWFMSQYWDWGVPGLATNEMGPEAAATAAPCNPGRSGSCG